MAYTIKQLMYLFGMVVVEHILTTFGPSVLAQTNGLLWLKQEDPRQIDLSFQLFTCHYVPLCWPLVGCGKEDRMKATLVVLVTYGS